MYEIILGRNKSDRELFGKDGTIFLGKHYVTMGREKSLANPVLLDIVRPHVLLVCGKRGSGKSYTLGVIAEELSNLPENIRTNLSCLIFDTLGIFWTMKFSNYKDSRSLKEWDIKAEKKDVIVFVPERLIPFYEKQGSLFDRGFSIKAKWMNAEDWCRLFEIDLNTEKGALISWAVASMSTEFSIQDLIAKINSSNEFSKELINQISARLQTIDKWGIFGVKGIEIEELFSPGKTSILDLSAYGQSSDNKIIKNLVVEIISRQILKKRMSARKKEEIVEIQQGNLFSKKIEKEPLAWILLDEAHEFISKEESLASFGLQNILKEGRQPGISLVLATQQVGKLHPDALSQADLILSHRVTSKSDIAALHEIMQSYISRDLILAFNALPKLKGSALMLDDNNEKIFPIQIRPRQSWHGGSDPKAMDEIKDLLKKQKENPFLKKLERNISELKEMR